MTRRKGAACDNGRPLPSRRQPAFLLRHSTRTISHRTNRASRQQRSLNTPRQALQTARNLAPGRDRYIYGLTRSEVRLADIAVLILTQKTGQTPPEEGSARRH
ncbi:hypothetical protein V5799_019286 [Amblyomma americanum]|uniref:Uncharacterized protein n=1 Tax=Amblyomma americanum TaxID=6943 RepID=A0AAQ4EXB1_AMBAM